MMHGAGFYLKKGAWAAVLIVCFAFPAMAAADASSQHCGPLCDFARDTLGRGQDIRVVESLKHFFQTQFAPDRNRQEFYRVRDLADYILFLKSRVRFFEDNNQLLKSFIESAGRGVVAAQQSLVRLNGDEDEIFETALRIDLISMGRADDLAQVVAVLKEVESSLMIQLKKMQIVNDELRSLKMRTAAHGRGMMLEEKEAAYFAHIEAMQAEMTEKMAVIERQDRDIQMLTLRADIFRERLHEAGEKIEMLTLDLTSITLDFFQEERESMALRKSADDMAVEFEESRERLRLVQHFVQEKDQYIQKLEEELTQIQIDMATGGAPGEVKFLRAEVIDAEGSLKDDIAQSQDKIRRLQERFQEVALANAHLESELSKKEFLVSLLERQVSAKNELIMDLERGFQLRMRQLSELREVIAIYQMKLKEYKEMLAERDRLMEGLHTRPDHVPLDFDSLGADFKGHGGGAMMTMPGSSMWTEDQIQEYSKDALDRLLSSEEN